MVKLNNFAKKLGNEKEENEGLYYICTIWQDLDPEKVFKPKTSFSISIYSFDFTMTMIQTLHSEKSIYWV